MSYNGQVFNGAALTDEEQYQLWLRDPAASVMHIVELGYVGATANYTLTLCDSPYPPYHEVIKSLPSFVRSIGADFTGMVSASIGQLVIDLTGGTRDSWLLLNIDGQPVRVYHGDPSWERYRFRRINTCIAEKVERASLTEMVIRLRGIDTGANLEVQDNLLVAPAQNVNAPIPLAYGQVFNVEPQLITPATREYQWHDGAVQAVTAVRDSGLDFETSSKTISSVNAGTDTLTFSTAHGFYENTRVRFTGTPPAPLAAATDYWVIAAGLTTTDARFAATRGGSVIDITGSTTGATCIGYHWTATLSTGKFLLDSAPAGHLTMDGQGHAPASGYIEDVCSIAEDVLDAVNVDQSSRAAFLAPYVQPVGIYIRDRRNRLEVVADVLRGVAAWYGYGRDGFLRYGRVVTSPTYAFKDIKTSDFIGELTVDSLIIPRQNHRVGYAKNWTIQDSGLAAGVTEANRALFASALKISLAAGDPPVASTHLLAAEPSVIETMLSDANAAAVEAARQNVLYEGWGAIFSGEVGRVGYTLEVGDAVKVTYSRYGSTINFTVGRMVTVISVDDRPSSGRVALKLFAQVGTYSPGDLMVASASSPLTLLADLLTSLVSEYSAGSAVPTFTRAAPATVTDHEGLLKTAIAGEARRLGARRVRNFGLPQAFTAIGSVTLTPGQLDPTGGTAATKCVYGVAGSGSRMVSNADASVAGDSVISVYLRGEVGGEVIRFWDGQSTHVTLPALTTSWGRYSISVTGHADQTENVLLYANAGTPTVYAAFPQSEDVTGQSNQNPSEYVSVGVLSAPFHGANVDGVKYFPYENGNTVVNNVVTEAQGAPIPDPTLQGFLPEGARTNLCLQSQDFSTTWNLRGSCTVTANQAAAPDGTTTADKIEGNGSSDSRVDQYITVSPNTAYTYTVYAEAGTNDYVHLGLDFAGIRVRFRLSTQTSATELGSPTATSIETLPSGRYRCRVSNVTGGAQTQELVQLYHSNSGNVATVVAVGEYLYLWGAQLEAGAFASAYIPTTTAAVTRNADLDSQPTAGNILAAQGTLYMEITPQHAPSGTVSFWGTYVDASNYTALLHDGTNLIFRKTISGVSYDATIANAFVSGTTYKVAASWGAGGSKIYLNGVAGTPHANTTAAQIAATMQIGADGNGANQSFAAIRKLRIWNDERAEMI